MEVWIFSNAPEFTPRAGVVAIVTVPERYGYRQAEDYALKLEDEYLGRGLEVTSIVRSSPSY
jgi:hypothetical protein